jgi:hypothetical protein
MRVPGAIALAAVLCICAAARARPSAKEQAVTVRSLKIDANSLPAGESQRLVQKYQGGSYSPEELAERVRQDLRDEGYYEAKCEPDGVKDSDDGTTADITLRVNAGAQYRLAGIHFTNATQFPAQQLRALFPVEDGALFNATAVGRGLERMKDLYAESGHINMGSIPQAKVDESLHTVELTVDVDQGTMYYFGRLLVDGAEPKAGAAQSLKDAWAGMQQKPYSPAALNEWLTAHAPYWPGTEKPIEHVKLAENPESQHVDVVVEFP